MIGVATRTILGTLASITVVVFGLVATGGTALAAQGICIHASVPKGPDLDANAIVLVASRVSSTVRDRFSL